jgi:multidrug efflux pump subunit AcrB
MFFMESYRRHFCGPVGSAFMAIAFMVLPAFGIYAELCRYSSPSCWRWVYVVDDAIVVIENTHRIYHDDKKLTIVQAAKKAAGEVFLPVLSGTATTLAPFVPLVFWNGIFGKFMVYLPVTVIITLTASLLVAYIINPVFAVWFMGDPKREGTELPAAKNAAELYSVMPFSGFLSCSFTPTRTFSWVTCC